ncbi:hypothetical protein BDP27DRAFT_1350057, partial [Rhodocollybia butyracea]
MDMFLKFISVLRYAFAGYGLILETLYPFEYSISLSVQEFLKFQTLSVDYCSAIISLSSFAFFLYTRHMLAPCMDGIIRLAMRSQPAYRAKV